MQKKKNSGGIAQSVEYGTKYQWFTHLLPRQRPGVKADLACISIQHNRTLMVWGQEGGGCPELPKSSHCTDYDSSKHVASYKFCHTHCIIQLYNINQLNAHFLN